jgi:hypothetical protein
MRRLGTVLTAGGVLAAVAAGPAAVTRALPPSPAGLAMSVRDVGMPGNPAQYPVRDAAGNVLRQVSYRVSAAGGNCCEKYVAASASGRLLELGGGNPFFSDDGGASWWTAEAPVPMLGGEGAITVTPTGDAVGASWDAYTGDRLAAVRYDAASGRWTYHENPLHTPFFDRPWLTVVEGPFTTPDGLTVPWISIVRGGLGLDREVELVSYDGLVYTEVAATSPVTAWLPARPGPLPVTSDPHTDLLQPHAQSRISPLPGGGAIRRQEAGFLCDSRAQVIEADRSWTCLDLGDEELAGDLRADSRGWLHNVVYGDTSVTYRVSTDGGLTWRATTHDVGGAITGTRPDFKVDSGRLRAFVALRVARTGGQQDTVLRFDVAGGGPALTEAYEIGLGDVVAGWDAGTVGTRMDFASIAILPDGRFAVAYADSTTRVGGGGVMPWLAVQL